jgi:hypothetical protein
MQLSSKIQGWFVFKPPIQTNFVRQSKQLIFCSGISATSSGTITYIDLKALIGWLDSFLSVIQRFPLHTVF